MSRVAPSRRLATILFLDIVGSTQIASELGDRRWRELLGGFRDVVRAELKRHHGHEEDTAGDGFFATFAQPAQALRAAAAIVGGVQEIGLDVRCGLHFGECETIDGRLGGIAVHIGARIMALGGAADVLVTGTVRDLVAGGDTQWEDRGSHELKGVPGAWQIWRLEKLDVSTLPSPLDPARAASIRESHRPAAAHRRRLRVVIAAVVGVAAVAAVGGVAAFLIIGPPPPTLAKIDPKTNAIVQTITDQYRSEHHPNSLWSVNGALWQASTAGFVGLVRRDISTGAVIQTIPVTGDPQAGAFGFGSIWIGGLSSPGSVDRWDAVTGREVAQLKVNVTIASMDASQTAIWVLGDKGDLLKVDPISNTVAGTYHTPTIDPGVVAALGDEVWVCDCEHHHIVEFNPVTASVVRTLTFPQAGFLVGLNDEKGQETAWLIDPDAATLTPIDIQSGQAGQPIGIGANLHGAVVSFGSLWVAAGDKVLRFRGDGPQELARIAMPTGMSAGEIAADPATGALWVGDCGCPIQ